MDIKQTLRVLQHSDASISIPRTDILGRHEEVKVCLSELAGEALARMRELEARIQAAGFAPGEDLRIQAPIINVRAEQHAESTDAYRQRIIDRFQKRPQGEPLKCHACGSRDLKDHAGYEEGHVVHISRDCAECGAACGSWDYGSWSW